MSPTTFKKGVDWEEVAKQIAAGERPACHQFADVFGNYLRVFFLGKGLSAWDAEDLAVSCVSDVVLKIGKYRQQEGGSFTAWVYQIARNHLVDWLRQRTPDIPLSEIATPEPVSSDAEPDIGRVLAVQDAVAQLSETDQQIIRLCDLGVQHTYQEIGEIVHITPGNARVRHHRALKRLQLILEQDLRISCFLKKKKGGTAFNEQ